jgi:hypothetical protein
MKTYIAELESVSPYSQSRFYETAKLDREQAAEYEERTWRGRMHVDSTGRVFIPPMSIKNCLSEAAKFLSVQIPGKGKSTYTKHFEAGILVTDPITLGIKADDVPGEWLFVPASGKRGDGKRVKKCFPVIHEWKGKATIYVLDEIITEKVLAEHLEKAGGFIGLGRFRPRNNGFYGRFKVTSLKQG